MYSLVVLVGFACLLSSVFSVPTSRFDCWSCKNMFSDEECTKKGEAILCNWNQVCYTESRVENGLYIINRGCKEINACEQLHMQNRTQCHPEINPSVCRTCCEKDHCNYHLDAGKGILNGSSEIPSTPNPVNGGSFIGARILNGGVTPEQPDEPKAPNCSHYIKPGPVPANLLPDEECRINILPQCINSGSLVFVLPKLPPFLREEGLNYRSRFQERGRCPKNPRLETKALYEDDDKFVFLTIVNYRYSNALPVAQKFDHLVGGITIKDFMKQEKSLEN